MTIRLTIPRVPKSPNRPLERDIQKAILEYLQMRGIFAFRVNTGAAMLPGRNGRKQLVRFGFAGVADIIGILKLKALMPEEKDELFLLPRNMSVVAPSYLKEYGCKIGRFLAIEVKRDNGQQTADQLAFERSVRQHGGLYILARSVDDVKKAIG